MSFKTQPTDKNIFKFQTDVEKIIVSNIKSARKEGIKYALANAKKVEDIPKMVKISTAVNQGVFFAWNQGLYGGIKHSETELNKQKKEKLEFSLSYGLNDIINFNETDDVIEGLKRRSKANYNRKLRNAWKKREKTEKVLLNLTQKELEDEILDPYDSAAQSLDIAQQREIYNTLNNRYTALSSGSDFAQTYLERRRATISSIAEKEIQEEIKNNIAEYISSRPSKKSQKELLKELTVMYSGKQDSDFKSIKSSLDETQEKLRDKVTRKELDEIEREIDEDPQVKKLAGFLEEEEEILAEAIARGDSAEEIRDLKRDLDSTRKEYKEARKKATTTEHKKRAPKKIRDQIANQERKLEEKLSKESKVVETEKEALRKLEEAATSDRQSYREAKAELDKLPDLLSNRRRALNTGKLSEKGLNRKERKILADRREKEKEVDRLKVALDQSADETKFKRKLIDELDSKLSKTEKTLEEGTFGVTSPTSRGKKAKLNDKQKEELRRLLDLKRQTAIDDLEGEFSITDIERLKDRVNRKANVFNDEKSTYFAERLASTEVTAAYNLGRLQVFLTNGISYVQWISTIDDRTSVFCQSLNKKVFALQDIFEHIMWVQRFPKTRKPEYAPENKSISPRGVWVPPAHPFCRSYLQPVYLREDEDALREDIKNKNLLDKVVSEGKLQARGADKSIRGLIKHQAKVRERQAKNYFRTLNITNNLFRAGVSIIAARFAEEGLASYSKEVTDEKRILEDDKELVSVLLGGTIALGTASMMYFFLKGNLSDTLKKTAKTALSPKIPDTKNFLGGMSKKETAAITADILEKIQEMGPAVKGRFTRPDEEGLQLLSRRNVEPLLSQGKDAYALAMSDIKLDDITQRLLSNDQLSVSAGDAYINRVYRNLTEILIEESAVLNRNSLDIIGQSFGNLGVGIDVDNIRDIQLWANGTANVIPKKGRATLVSGKKLQKALSSNKFRKQVIDTSRRAQKNRRVLQEIQAKLDPSDVITRGKISQEIKKLNKLVALQRLPQLKMTPVVKELADELDEVFKLDIVKQQDFTDIQEGFESVSQASKNVLDKFKANLPRSADFSLNPSTITSVPKLKSLLIEVNNSLEKVENTFLFKDGNKFKPGRIEEIVDISDTLENLQNTSEKLAGTSINVNYQSTIDKINEVVSDQMSNDYNFLLKRKIEIRKRIKELE